MSMKSDVTMTDSIMFKSEDTQPGLRYNICVKLDYSMIFILSYIITVLQFNIFD